MSINVDARLFYLDYVNNYLTVGRIAEDWDIPIEEAYRLIEQGKSISYGR